MRPGVVAGRLGADPEAVLAGVADGGDDVVLVGGEHDRGGLLVDRATLKVRRASSQRGESGTTRRSGGRTALGRAEWRERAEVGMPHRVGVRAAAHIEGAPGLRPQGLRAPATHRTHSGTARRTTPLVPPRARAASRSRASGSCSRGGPRRSSASRRAPARSPVGAPRGRELRHAPLARRQRARPRALGRARPRAGGVELAAHVLHEPVGAAAVGELERAPQRLARVRRAAGAAAPRSRARPARGRTRSERSSARAARPPRAGGRGRRRHRPCRARAASGRRRRETRTGGRPRPRRGRAASASSSRPSPASACARSDRHGSHPGNDAIAWSCCSSRKRQLSSVAAESPSSSSSSARVRASCA